VVDYNEDEGLIFVKREELVVKVPAQEIEVGK
jgi:hypothetical protein